MIVLVPIGDIDLAVLESLRQPLAAVYREEVVIGKSLPLPPESLNPEGRQNDAEAILESIPNASRGARSLGIADVDLFVRGLNFVFGLADDAGSRALISLWRLRQEAYGLPRDDLLFRRRALTEAVHELGHAHGLGHCSSTSCVMHFSNSLSETDAKGCEFCFDCRRKME